jgi:hypothetical protein
MARHACGVYDRHEDQSYLIVVATDSADSGGWLWPGGWVAGPHGLAVATRVTGAGAILDGTLEEVPTMRYAMMAEANWKADAPEDYRRLKNKAAFFAGLEAEAQSQVDAMVDSVPPIPRETFLQRATRLQAAQQMAEEIVVRELLTPPAPEEERLDPATGVPLPDPETPEDRELREALADFQDAWTEWRETAPAPEPETTPEPPA